MLKHHKNCQCQSCDITVLARTITVPDKGDYVMESVQYDVVMGWQVNYKIITTPHFVVWDERDQMLLTQWNNLAEKYA